MINFFNAIPATLISFSALSISLITLYLNFLRAFKGRVLFSERVTILFLNDIPSICLLCSMENSGAIHGACDDIRVEIKSIKNGSSNIFYPIIMKEYYSIFENFNLTEWSQFCAISLPAKCRKETHIIFKPLNDNYLAIDGVMEVSLQVRWYGKNNWENIGKKINFTLTPEIAAYWRDKNNKPLQITSDTLMQYRTN